MQNIISFSSGVGLFSEGISRRIIDVSRVGNVESQRATARAGIDRNGVDGMVAGVAYTDDHFTVDRAGLGQAEVARLTIQIDSRVRAIEGSHDMIPVAGRDRIAGRDGYGHAARADPKLEGIPLVTRA